MGFILKIVVEGLVSEDSSDVEVEAILDSLRRELDEEKREGILEDYELDLVE